MISVAVASSTYLTLLLHLAAIPFPRMQKSRGGEFGTLWSPAIEPNRGR